MNEIDTFIKEARNKGLSDEEMRAALEANGWSNEEITLALSDLSVPTKQAAASEPVPQVGKPASLSPLMAALHHILLWFFTASSTVTIVGVIVSLFGEEISTDALAAMIAVTIVTFIPYAVLFAVFLRMDHKRKGLIPGKVWSIITVCLHSIGAMIAAITLVVTAITGGTTSVLVGAGLVLLLNVIVITTYCFGAFSLAHVPRLRKVVITLHLPVLVILFGILSLLSFLQIGPAKHDDQLRQNLVTTVQKVRTYAKDHRELPMNGDGMTTSPEIHYTKKTTTTYELCADFQLHQKAPIGSAGLDSYGNTSASPLPDEYVYKEQFRYYSNGRCFVFSSSSLEGPSTNMPYPDVITQ